MPKITKPLSELQQYIGHEFEPSAWFEVEQARINTFADCTEDHQYIHVDPERAAATPLGGTIAHGFLVLSLLSALCEDNTVVPEDATMGLNYGLNRVRFLYPVRAGKRIRARVKIADIDDKQPGRIVVAHTVTTEIEGEAKPALVAYWLIAWMRS